MPLTVSEIRVFFDRTLDEQRDDLGWWLMREPAGDFRPTTFGGRGCNRTGDRAD
jgi:hypothetical protein